MIANQLKQRQSAQKTKERQIIAENKNEGFGRRQGRLRKERNKTRHGYMIMAYSWTIGGVKK